MGVLYYGQGRPTPLAALGPVLSSLAYTPHSAWSNFSAAIMSPGEETDDPVCVVAV